MAHLKRHMSCSLSKADATDTVANSTAFDAQQLGTQARTETCILVLAAVYYCLHLPWLP